MIKLDIVNHVINNTGVNRQKAEIAVDTLFDAMKKAILKGERIELRGFGVFQPKARKTGIGRNPKTGQAVPIVPGKSLKFKPGSELR
jgi:DNA-binding protein HU-beta